MLELNGIGKTFLRRGSKVDAVRDITITAAPGDVVGILGPNGAGKTTLLRILTTALKPTSGTGTILGYDLHDKATDVRRIVGFVSGDFALYNKLTGTEYLQYFGALNGMRRIEIRDRIEALSTQFKMGEFLSRRCAEYSTGMRQKLSISRAILHNPLVLLFDEATSNLDIDASSELISLVMTRSRAAALIIYTTHRVPELQRLCNKLLIMKSGRQLYFDGIDALRQDGTRSLEESYAHMLNLADPT